MVLANTLRFFKNVTVMATGLAVGVPDKLVTSHHGRVVIPDRVASSHPHQVLPNGQGSSHEHPKLHTSTPFDTKISVEPHSNDKGEANSRSRRGENFVVVKATNATTPVDKALMHRPTTQTRAA